LFKKKKKTGYSGQVKGGPYTVEGGSRRGNRAREKGETGLKRAIKKGVQPHGEEIIREWKWGSQERRRMGEKLRKDKICGAASSERAELANATS